MHQAVWEFGINTKEKSGRKTQRDNHTNKVTENQGKWQNDYINSRPTILTTFVRAHSFTVQRGNITKLSSACTFGFISKSGG